jgi:hypothetical protein
MFSFTAISAKLYYSNEAEANNYGKEVKNSNLLGHPGFEMCFNGGIRSAAEKVYGWVYNRDREKKMNGGATPNTILDEIHYSYDSPVCNPECTVIGIIPRCSNEFLEENDIKRKY